MKPMIDFMIYEYQNSNDIPFFILITFSIIGMISAFIVLYKYIRRIKMMNHPEFKKYILKYRKG